MSALLPAPGSAVRVARAGDDVPPAVLHCRVAASSDEVLLLAPALHSGSAAPLAPGDGVELRHATAGGLDVMRTVVVRAADGLLAVRRPRADDVAHVQRREAVRVETRLAVRVATASEPRRWAVGETADLSGSGARIVLPHAPDSEEVEVVLDLDGTTVHSRCRVVRRQQLRRGEGLAVEFLGMSEQDRERVVARVSAEQHAAPPRRDV